MKVVIICALVPLLAAAPFYRGMFPNGYNVPNPCANDLWQAVGHMDPYHHTMEKNQFGKDFAAAGHTWTHALCMKDSDGDGRTNGEELGDPGCKWNVGDKPADVARGQPGICEPVGSHACRGQNFTCGTHHRVNLKTLNL
ncbi:temptin-like [Ostrea edulis]|uniref:temptin-like n=1 Tax=Ostrea edulis TaxID=37623 RepID=UPI0020951EE5|nr:temptin-like [Ostrea edulis]